MKLSTRSRYGIRMLLEIALNSSEKPVLLKDIAKNQNISEKYLSQLIIPLKGANLVLSSRGAHGGYNLAKKPEEINFKEIIDILEGDVTLVECVKNEEICGRVRQCAARDIWSSLDSLIGNYLKSVTLKTLVDIYNQKSSECGNMYFI